MIYLLDTNTCITYLKVPTSPIRTRLAALQPGDVVVTLSAGDGNKVGEWLLAKLQNRVGVAA